jgi:uncharacterized integral membrane protein (TIGR00697 family)
VSNLAAVKLFEIGPFIFSGGIIVFPLSYIFGDVLSEVYGFARTRRIIWAGLVANVFMVTVLWSTIRLPSAPGWNYQEEFAAVHGFIPRIVLGSLVAYWMGEFANSVILSRMKVWTNGRMLWTRTIASTIVGEFVDTLVFVLIAFTGTVPPVILVAATISGWLFKVLYEIIATPLTYKIVGYLKKIEGVDHYDRSEVYNPFKF